MDRETRKANLKKLRLTGIKHTGESSNKLWKSQSISKYFSTHITHELKHTKHYEEVNNDPIDKLNTDSRKIYTCKKDNSETPQTEERRERTNNLSSFVFNKGRKIEDKIQEDSETCTAGVFEIPPKKVKKTEKLRHSKNYSKSAKSRAANQQCNIKTSLLRSEHIFSEITSQQCRDDNFSADEILLALALSKSQVETSGTVFLDSNEEVAHQHVETKTDNKLRQVPNILRQYGFRATSPEDYSSLITVQLPGGNRRIRTKWINKFTALTLRDSNLQKNKVRSKIESLIAQQLDYKTIDETEYRSTPYFVISSELQKLKTTSTNRIENNDEINVAEFYVSSLFEVARVQAGYLFKDWHSIQGRARSPRSDNKSQIKKIERKMNLTFLALEDHFRLNAKSKQDKNEMAENSKEPTIKKKESNKAQFEIYEAKNLYSRQNNYNEPAARLLPDSFECYIKESKYTKVKNDKMPKSIFTDIADSCKGESTLFKDNTESELSKFNSTDKDIFDNSELNLNSCVSSPINSEKCHITRTLSPNIFSSSEDESEEISDIVMTTKYHQGFYDVPTSYNANLLTNFKKPLSEISQIIELTPEVLTQQSNDTAAVQAKRNETLNFNFEVIECSNSNLIQLNCDQYIRKSLLIMEVNSLKNQSSNAINYTKCVNDSGKTLALPSDNISLRDVVKEIEPSMLNFEKSVALPCILEHPYGSKTSNIEHCIDVTKDDENEDFEDCIVLSDDEINYSIWKADISRGRIEFMSRYTNSKIGAEAKETENSDDFSMLDFIETKNLENNTNKKNASTNIMPACNDIEMAYDVSCSSGITDRDNEQLGYGVVNNEFNYFTQGLQIFNTQSHHMKFNDNLTPSLNTPFGLEQLLTGDISLNGINENNSPIKSRIYTPLLNLCNYPPDEYEIAGRMYTVRIVTDPKPNFMHKSEAEIFKQLYDFGIKPLKRKQAIKMLEYIYYSTHPVILTQSSDLSADIKVENGLRPPTDIEPNRSMRPASGDIDFSPTKLQSSPCVGANTLKLMKLDFEEDVFQTNVTKKTPRPLLPLHIAWYNLVSSSITLHEKILMYKPIDLHEIYVFFKQLGYRFEPKDLKKFFDRRCIVFRYDLGQPGHHSERHIRKSKTKQKKECEYNRNNYT